MPFLFHLPHFCHRHSELHFSIYLGTDSDLDPKKKKIQQKPRQPAKLQSSLRRKFTHFSATLSGPSRAGFTPIGLSWVVFLPENSPKCNKHARYSATHSYIDTFDGLLKCKETKRAKLDMADSLEASHFKPWNMAWIILPISKFKSRKKPCILKTHFCIWVTRQGENIFKFKFLRLGGQILSC